MNVADAISSDLNDTIRRFAKQDTHLNVSELEWIPYVAEGVRWKPLRFDVSRGISHVLLHFDRPGVLGRHQHHGAVTGFVLEGSWFYREYDWIATPGSIINEAPGAIHTLETANPQGMLTLFILEGVMDFFGDDDGWAGTQIVFWNIHEYVTHCERNNLKINEKLFYS